MAKQSFKDLIFKFLKKDEEAPANATGTAVAGTGDDSSTVVVKKKKELQKKLMTRMGITETIDRTIPDLEYPKDEIRERVDQLKQFALGETPEGFALVSKAKDIAKKMSGNMNGAIKEIEKLEKGLSNNSSVKDALKKANEELSEGERALARDKSTDQPKKYVSGLTDKQKKAHDRHLEKQGKKSDSDKSAYKQSPADKVAKTKPSKHTNKFKKMYGEDYLNEKIKGFKDLSDLLLLFFCKFFEIHLDPRWYPCYYRHIFVQSLLNNRVYLSFPIFNTVRFPCWKTVFLKIFGYIVRYNP